MSAPRLCPPSTSSPSERKNAMSQFSRRSLMKGAMGLAGAGVGRSLWPSTAAAQTTEEPAVVVVHLNGGFSALFNSTDVPSGDQPVGYFSASSFSTSSSLPTPLAWFL